MSAFFRFVKFDDKKLNKVRGRHVKKKTKPFNYI